MAEKPKKQRKFKQARRDAKGDAKKTFSGKRQAGLRDKTAKQSTDDIKALNETKSKDGKWTAKYPVEDSTKGSPPKPGEKVRPRMEKVTVAEDPSTSWKAREASRNASIDRFRAENYGTKAAEPKSNVTSISKKAAEKKAAKENAKKAAAKKVAEKKATTKVAATTDAPPQKRAVKKTTTKKAVKANKASVKTPGKELVKYEPKASAKAGTEVVAKPKGEVVKTASTAKKAETVVGKAKKFGKIKKLGGRLALATVGVEAIAQVNGSVKKDWKEIERLENKLAALQGKKPKYKPQGKEGVAKGMFKQLAGPVLGGGIVNGRDNGVTNASHLANNLTLGLVGKTRRERMDELNALIKKQEAKNAKNKPKELRYGPNGESLVPGTKAYQQGSTVRPTRSTSKSSTTSSTPKTVKGAHVVKTGDTLWGIAKANKTTVAKLYEANPTLAARKKAGKVQIFSGTKVRIPKK